MCCCPPTRLFETAFHTPGIRRTRVFQSLQKWCHGVLSASLPSNALGLGRPACKDTLSSHTGCMSTTSHPILQRAATMLSEFLGSEVMEYCWLPYCHHGMLFAILLSTRRGSRAHAFYKLLRNAGHMKLDTVFALVRELKACSVSTCWMCVLLHTGTNV